MSEDKKEKEQEAQKFAEGMVSMFEKIQKAKAAEELIKLAARLIRTPGQEKNAGLLIEKVMDQLRTVDLPAQIKADFYGKLAQFWADAGHTDNSTACLVLQSEMLLEALNGGQ